jgi:hypothetical protein
MVVIYHYYHSKSFICLSYYHCYYNSLALISPLTNLVGGSSLPL